jgi:hypothetical protein
VCCLKHQDLARLGLVREAGSGAIGVVGGPAKVQAVGISSKHRFNPFQPLDKQDDRLTGGDACRPGPATLTEGPAAGTSVYDKSSNRRRWAHLFPNDEQSQAEHWGGRYMAMCMAMCMAMGVGMGVGMGTGKGAYAPHHADLLVRFAGRRSTATTSRIGSRCARPRCCRSRRIISRRTWRMITRSRTTDMTCRRCAAAAAAAAADVSAGAVSAA